MHRSPLYQAAAAFHERILSVKAGLDVAFEWYPYNTLANVEHLGKLLADCDISLDGLLARDLVLDLGCGDGEWAFFLESLGCRVHAIDCPVTNHNAMAGVHTLKAALDSSVEIHAADLDARFTLPSRAYRGAFFFGTLYHLKNPFYVLEELARTTRYCFLSTRVANHFHPRLGDIHDLPLAYLLGADELNDDDTNFWIFSRAGLERLLRRAGWNVVSSYLTPANRQSTPWSLDADERMFCLVESACIAPDIELLEGWYAPEDAGWRWTARCFRARLEVPPGPPGSLDLYLDLFLPDMVPVPLTVAASVDETRLPAEVLDRRGHHIYLRPITSTPGKLVTVEFTLDRAIPPDDTDRRERGIIVTALRIQRRG